jgi:hypothetical protein
MNCILLGFLQDAQTSCFCDSENPGELENPGCPLLLNDLWEMAEDLAGGSLESSVERRRVIDGVESHSGLVLQ